MTEQQHTPKWYAVYTTARAEKKAYKGLALKNIEAFLPLQKTLRTWSDRKKWGEMPLIRSYVFVHITEREYYHVLDTPGVVRFITFSGKAVSIPNWQIEALKKVLATGEDFEVTTDIFKSGDRIRVTRGPFSGLEGELIEQKGKKKVLIRIEHTGHSILLTIPISYLRQATKL